MSHNKVETFKTALEESLFATLGVNVAQGTLNPQLETTRQRVMPGLFALLNDRGAHRSAPLDPTIIEAVAKYNTTEHQQMFKAWIKNSPNKNSILDADGNTILHHAASTGKSQMIPFLIKQGLNVNAENDKHDTPLYATVVAFMSANNTHLQERLIDTIKALIANGAKNLSGTALPKSVMSLAATSGNLELVQLLHRSGFNLNEGDLFDPLTCAKMSKNRNPALIAYMQANSTVEGAAKASDGFKPSC